MSILPVCLSVLYIVQYNTRACEPQLSGHEVSDDLCEVGSGQISRVGVPASHETDLPPVPLFQSPPPRSLHSPLTTCARRQRTNHTTFSCQNVLFLIKPSPPHLSTTSRPSTSGARHLRGNRSICRLHGSDVPSSLTPPPSCLGNDD